jgi:hypothetical protein
MEGFRVHGLMYRGRNSFDALPGFEGLAEGNNSPRLRLKIQELPQSCSFSKEKNIFKFRNLTKV